MGGGDTKEGFWQTETIRGGSGKASRRHGAGLYPKYRACSTTVDGPLGSLSIKPTRLSREDAHDAHCYTGASLAPPCGGE